MGQEIFNDGQGLADILSQAGYHELAGVAGGAEIVVAGQSVQLHGNVGLALFGRTQVAEIAGGEGQVRIGVGTHVAADTQLGYVVLVVVLVKHFQALVAKDGHVFVKVYEHRFDGSRFVGGNLLQEGALLVTVGNDGGNLRGLNLLLIRINTVVLVYDGVVVGAQVFVGPFHNVLLGEGSNTVHLLYL